MLFRDRYSVGDILWRDNDMPTFRVITLSCSSGRENGKAFDAGEIEIKGNENLAIQA